LKGSISSPHLPTSRSRKTRNIVEENESSKTGSCKIKKLLQNAYNSQNGNMMVNDAKKASGQSKREKSHTYNLTFPING
jgi:hypothetical protein